jgi:hypothetical protein
MREKERGFVRRRTVKEIEERGRRRGRRTHT